MGSVRAVCLCDRPLMMGSSPSPRVLPERLVASLLLQTADDRFAAVRFPLCTVLVFGAQMTRPSETIRYTSADCANTQSMRSSARHSFESWRRRNSVHPRHDRDSYLRGKRHCVFTFQDSALECIVAAEQWWASSIDVFERNEEAERSWRSMRHPPGHSVEHGVK